MLNPKFLFFCDSHELQFVFAHCCISQFAIDKFPLAFIAHPAFIKRLEAYFYKWQILHYCNYTGNYNNNQCLN